MIVLTFLVLTAATPAFADEPQPSSGDGPIDQVMEETEPTRDFLTQTATDLSCEPAPSCGKSRVVDPQINLVIQTVFAEGGPADTILDTVFDDDAAEPVDEAQRGAWEACGQFCLETADELITEFDRLFYEQLHGFLGDPENSEPNSFWGTAGKCAVSWGATGALAGAKGGLTGAALGGASGTLGCILWELIN